MYGNQVIKKVKECQQCEVFQLRWYPATLISHHFTPTKDAGTGKAKSAAYWLVHGSVRHFVMYA